MNGDVQHVHAEKRAAAGTRNIWIVGGGDLAGQLYDAGLLDELIIQIGVGMVELRYEVHKSI